MPPSREVPQKHFNSSKEKQRAQATAATFTTVLLSTCKTGENQCLLAKLMAFCKFNAKKVPLVPTWLI